MIISTIHSAKGLEADICFVVNVSPTAFPSAWSIGNFDEVEEDRRVLYVALTRAKNELIITRNNSSVYAESRMTRLGEESLNEEHYFLNGLPDGIAEQDSIEVNKRELYFGKVNSLNINYGMDFS